MSIIEKIELLENQVVNLSTQFVQSFLSVCFYMQKEA